MAANCISIKKKKDFINTIRLLTPSFSPNLSYRLLTSLPSPYGLVVYAITSSIPSVWTDALFCTLFARLTPIHPAKPQALLSCRKPS